MADTTTPAAPVPETFQGCSPAVQKQYHDALHEWNACQFCARYGWGTMQAPGGSWTCNRSNQKPNAYGSCQRGPVNPCTPFLHPPLNQWDVIQPYSKGSIVWDPRYGYTIYGFWNSATGKPYLASEAPYLREGGCAPPL